MIIIAIFREMTSKWYQGQLGGPNYLLVTSLLPERQITNQLTALCCFRITIATTHITPLNTLYRVVRDRLKAVFFGKSLSGW